MRVLIAALFVLHAPLAAQDRDELVDVGSTVPKLTCSDTAGKPIDWDVRWKGKGVVLVFHSAGMAYSERALEDVVKAWSSTNGLAGKLGVLIVTSSKSSVGDLSKRFAKSGLDVAITVDPDRKGFKQYKVIAFPTILVVAKDRKVLHIEKGYGPRLATKVVAASKHAAGTIDQAGYEKLVSSGNAQQQSAAYVRVARTVPMARKLIASGMVSEACDTLARVMPGDSDHLAGIALLADLYLRLNETEKARPWVHRLKNFNADAPGLPFLWAGLAIQDGDPDTAFKHLANQDPEDPRTGYLSGQAYELQKKYELAAREYRKSLRALMNRRLK